MKNRTIKSMAKRLAALAMAAVCTFSLTQVPAVKAAEVLEAGDYVVPITSLKSKAPIPAVNEAFNKAFGENANVSVDEKGNMTATVENRHMVINMMGEYHANVLTVEGAEYLSYKTEQSSTLFGKPTEITQIEVPEKMKFPITPSGNGECSLTITVDFMNNMMGGGKPYPTTVTLTLDFSKAQADTSGLNALLQSYDGLKKEDYTEESWKAFELKKKEAKELLAGGKASASEISGMIASLKDLKGKLQLVSELPEADYSKVDAAIATVPKDLTKYTDGTVKTLENALQAVIRGLKQNEQDKVNQMAANIEAAVKGLKKKPTSDNNTNNGTNNDTNSQPNLNTGNTTLDKNNLKDGIYEVPVWLWHATKNQASMAAQSLNNTARIVVKNGVKTMYIYTKSMKYGNIEASLQELKVEGADGKYISAKVEERDAAGNPVCFSFTLPHTKEYLNVKVNPHVAIMGNQDIDARFRINYSSLKQVSSVQVTKPSAQSSYGASNAPKTADYSNYSALLLAMLLSAAASVATLVYRKRQAR
ncbi:hypothetical protein HMPREF9477_01303 [Lachnospiraceae bacterium 2_1_46FAA]|nr:hypothetical protein HMPREF9477_01303 [Lachnospiraceae bacterium 2_1_46FAA]